MKEIIDRLLYESESESLDFKSEQYKFVGCEDIYKSELLKDILAFANSWRRTDAYILVGVKENKGGRAEVVGVDEQIDDAQLQQFVNQKTQRPISFSCFPFEYDDKSIFVIKIGSQERPIYLLKDFTKLKKNLVYIRRGSSTAISAPDEVSKMGSPSGELYSKEPKLVFGFADLEARQTIGSNLKIQTTILNIENESSIPTYGNSGSEGSQFFAPVVQDFTKNKDYYREMAVYIKKKLFVSQVCFYLTNESNVVATDVNIELIIKNDSKDLTIIEKYQLPNEPSPKGILFSNNIGAMINNSSSRTEIKKTETDLFVSLFIEKSQPRQTIFHDDTFMIGSRISKKIDINYFIYSDNLSEPLSGLLSLHVDAENKSIYYQELLNLNK